MVIEGQYIMIILIQMWLDLVVFWCLIRVLSEWLILSKVCLWARHSNARFKTSHNSLKVKTQGSRKKYTDLFTFWQLLHWNPSLFILQKTHFLTNHSMDVFLILLIRYLVPVVWYIMVFKLECHNYIWSYSPLFTNYCTTDFRILNTVTFTIKYRVSRGLVELLFMWAKSTWSALC